MASNMFHLGWFLGGASPQQWNAPWSGRYGYEWNTLDIYADMFRSLERAGFDYVLIEDSSHVPGGYRGSHEVFVRRGLTTPKLDPSPVAAVLSTVTRHMGIIPTLSITEYPPYLLARLVSSLDQISGGRSGWNIITGGADQAAKNYGMDALPPHDLRYEMAEEYVTLVKQLWDSWEPDSLVRTPGGPFADPEKVHVVDFAGKYYKSRGPLQSGPAPQGRPVLAQAGGSDRGRAFAANHAETIVVAPKSVQVAKEYRNDLRARMSAAGRDPDGCKLLYTVAPVLGETMAEAEAKFQRKSVVTEAVVERNLALLSKKTDIDFGSMDLDAPLGELTTNGHQSVLVDLLDVPPGTTLRQVAGRDSGQPPLPLVGTPSHVAGLMGEMMDEIGGDGLLVTGDTTRRGIAEVTDGLIPELRKAGLTREEYTGSTLRENLLAF